MKNKIIEIDFYELIKIVISGVWVIALFAVLGILISYIYVNNSVEERRFGITVPMSELKKNDMGIVEEINDNFKNLFHHIYEKNLTQYPESKTVKNNIFLDTFDETIITSLQVAKSEGEYENDFTVKDIQNMIFDSVRDDKILKNTLRDYNKHIKENFGENDFRIIINVDHESHITEEQGVLNTIYFNKPYDKDIANIYANIFLNLIHVDVNRKLNVFYKRATDRYFYEIEYLRANIKTIVESLASEYKLYLDNTVAKIKFHRELAMELKYSLPQPSSAKSISAFSFLNGYRYLDKVLIELEKKMQEDFTQVIPELRFFTETLQRLDRNVTFNRVEERMKKLGLLDNNINLFSIHADRSANSSSVTKLRLFEKSNAFLVMYGGIFGVLVGILFSFIIHFARSQKETS